jgi:hypothetical protein
LRTTLDLEANPQQEVLRPSSSILAARQAKEALENGAAWTKMMAINIRPRIPILRGALVVIGSLFQARQNRLKATLRPYHNTSGPQTIKSIPLILI